MIRCSILFMLAASTLSCAQDLAQDPRNEGVSETAIVGGKRVGTTNPIASVTVSIVDPDPSVGQFCSGVLVDQDVVISAAHCFQNNSTRPHVHFLSRPKDIIAVRSVAIHGRFSLPRSQAYDDSIYHATTADDITFPETPINDIALLLLDTPAPQNLSPASLIDVRVEPADQEITSAGFGCTSTKCGGMSDVLKSVVGRYVKYASKSNMILLDASKNRGPCNGDSGGPDFLASDDKLGVLAIVTTGPHACEAGLSVDTAVAPYIPWIKRTANTLRSSAPSRSVRRFVE